MLEVELDIFSGMPNPVWLLTSREERELYERLTAEPDQISPAHAADEQFSLGYRGFIVRPIKTDDGAWSMAMSAGGGAPFPNEFRVGHKPAEHAPAAELLLQTSEKPYAQSLVTDELRAIVASGVDLMESATVDDAATAFTIPPATDSRFPTLSGEDPHSPGRTTTPGEITTEGVTWWACPSSYFSANAAFFNDPAHVGRNNCYCFASNHRADIRYARPGQRGGQPATSMSCGSCIQGLYADGWRDGCQPNGLTIVMVIWPNVDYHFYRLVTGGPNWWWGHKPGGTPAKYTDDCGHAIYQQDGRGYAPNNICRGGYTDFCGYFYQNNSTAFVA
jgi:hypothetical protein